MKLDPKYYGLWRYSYRELFFLCLELRKKLEEKEKDEK